MRALPHAAPAPLVRDRMRYSRRAMAECKSCGDEVDELVTVSVGGRKKRVCEDCADELREQEEIAEASESVVQDMMGFKGRR